MRLLKVRMHNVFSIGDIELSLNRRGISLITGFSLDENDVNGSGKSSVAHKAIMWGLFGTTGFGARADRVRRKNASKTEPSFVEIEFEGVDNKVYSVYRTRNPNGLELKQGNEFLTRRNERDTQDLINHFLGRDFNTFVQVDFFGQGRSSSYAELTPMGQKEVLESILPIKKLNTWAEEAKRLKKETFNNRQEHDKDKFELTGRVNQLNSQIDYNRRRKIEWDKSRAQELDKLSKKLAYLDTIEFDVKSFVLKDSEESLIEKISFLNSLEQQKAEAISNQIKWNSYISEKSGALVPLQETCFSCGRDFDTESLKVAINKNKEIKGNIETGKENLETVNDVYNKLNSQIIDLKNEINILDTNIKKYKEFERFSDNADTLKDQIETIKQAENPYEIQTLEFEKEREEFLNKKKEIDNKIQSITEEVNNFHYWELVFSRDLKNFLLESVCPFLDNMANYYITALGNPQIHIHFSTIRRNMNGDIKEEFNVAVNSSTGGAEYLMLSGGEQQLANFAIELALSDLAETQTNVSSKFMVLDEPFTNLGPTNSERLVNFLVNELSKRKETLFLISNEEELKTLIPSRIHVVKEGGITRLEEI